jgi:perosamine synthetase
MQELKNAGVACSVHWRPLHLHPYYQMEFGWPSELFPVASNLWERLVSLPIFPAMTGAELRCVADAVKRICAKQSRQVASGRAVPDRVLAMG